MDFSLFVWIVLLLFTDTKLKYKFPPSYKYSSHIIFQICFVSARVCVDFYFFFSLLHFSSQYVNMYFWRNEAVFPSSALVRRLRNKIKKCLGIYFRRMPSCTLERYPLRHFYCLFLPCTRFSERPAALLNYFQWINESVA